PDRCQGRLRPEENQQGLDESLLRHHDTGQRQAGEQQEFKLKHEFATELWRLELVDRIHDKTGLKILEQVSMQAVTVRVHQSSQRANSGQNRIELQKKPALRVPPEKPFESVADRDESQADD